MCHLLVKAPRKFNWDPLLSLTVRRPLGLSLVPACAA